MEPYQKAAEAIREGEEKPLHFLKNAGLTAIGGGIASAGSKAVSKLIPSIGALINNYVPENLSSAGLSKIDPRFGKFIQGALQEGYSYDDLRSFIGEKVDKTQSSEKAKDTRNLIEQYDPELHTYISQKIKEGMSPIEAGQKALGHGRFKNAVDKLTKEHKTPWSSILQSIYGTGQTAQPQQKQGFQPQPGQQGQASPGSQALMAMLQKINQRLGQ